MLLLTAYFFAAGGKVIIIIGGDDNYKNEEEEERSVMSRWARRMVSSQLKGEFLDWKTRLCILLEREAQKNPRGSTAAFL